jgi:hypothetical protein
MKDMNSLAAFFVHGELANEGFLESVWHGSVGTMYVCEQKSQPSTCIDQAAPV